MIRLLPIPAGVQNMCFRRPVIVIIEIALLIQDLAVQKLYLLSGFRIQTDFNIAGDLLAEIHHGLSGGRMDDFFRQDPFDFPDHLAFLRNQDVLGPVQDHCLFPVCRLNRRIIGFSIIDLTEAYRAFRPLPGIIRRDDLFAPVFIHQTNLANKSPWSCGSSGFILLIGKARHRGRKPSLSHCHLQVIPFLQHSGNIIGLDLKTLLIGRPPRRQHIIADSLSIKHCFINA